MRLRERKIGYVLLDGWDMESYDDNPRLNELPYVEIIGARKA